MKNIVFLIGIFFFSYSSAELQFHSERIKLMDIEVLQQLVTKNLKKLENRDENPEPLLKESLEIIFAQPDQSLAASNIFDELRSKSGTDKAFSDVLNSIVDDAVGSINKSAKDPDLQREQNTYVYILNNMIAELQKMKQIDVYRAVIEKIRDADIDFSDHLVAHRLLNSMSQLENPSRYAATVIPKKKPWWKFW